MNLLSPTSPEEHVQHFREHHALSVRTAGLGYFAVHRFMHRYGPQTHEHLERDRKRGWIPWQFSSKAKVS